MTRFSVEDDRSNVQTALSELEAEAATFARRFIQDSNARRVYIQQTKKLSSDFKAAVRKGLLSPKHAAEQVQLIRNKIMEAQRLRSSDIGGAKAVALKKPE